MMRHPWVSRVCCISVLMMGCARTPPPPKAPSEAPTKDGTGAREGMPVPAAFSEPSVSTPGNAGPRKGEVTLVMFWATWNMPCKLAFPALQSLSEKHPGLTIVAVSVDDPMCDLTQNGGCDMLREASRSWGGKFPIVWDRDKIIARAWLPPTMPTLYLVSRELRVLRMYTGYHESSIDVIEQDVAAALAARL